MLTACCLARLVNITVLSGRPCIYKVFIYKVKNMNISQVCFFKFVPFHPFLSPGPKTNRG